MQRDSSIAVNIAGKALKFPWAGGHNFTNWGLMDLDNDGFKDLVVYDKSGGKIRTYINDKIAGQASFTHNSVYQSGWPQVNSWMKLFDYNCDGKEDVFTYSNGAGGILVHKNVSVAGNFQFVPVGHFDAGLNAWYLVSDYTPVGVSGPPLNIPVNQVALPGLSDMDGDGDMDILVFNAQGYNIEYHQNQSKELGYNCDSLIFKAIDDCWGDISESTCAVNLNVCPFPKIASKIRNYLQNGAQHAGSCIMCFDADGDALTDVLLGDVVCDSVIYMHNAGFVNNAHIDNFTSVYPPAQPVSMTIFPCTYFLDLNNDGKRDLVAAPALQGSENISNTWLYTNGNTDNSPVFTYVKNNFLQEDMIDLGEGSFPAMFDYEGDGDLDLLAGNFGYYGTPYVSKIALFLNTGTTATPTFTLLTDDYAGLSANGQLNLAPTTGDLDGDGDPDLLVGDNTGRFSYFTNTAGFGNPAAFSSTATANFGNGFLAGMDVGLKAYPQIIDLDKDGVLDIIAGNQAGKIFYYRNIGTTTVPSFSLVSNALGGVNVLQPLCSSLGNAMPFVFNDNGSYKMLVGSECGSIYLYHNIDGNLGGTFAQINASAFGLFEGQHTAPVLHDLNGDSRLDMLLGNYSGGLSFFRGLSTNFYNVDDFEIFTPAEVFPNPAQNEINLTFNQFNTGFKKVRLLDISGKLVIEKHDKGNFIKLETHELSNGIYILKVEMLNEKGEYRNNFTQKIVLAHE